MKKGIIVLFAVFGLCQTSKAQSHLDVTISNNLYVDAVTIVFIDGTSEEHLLGSQGIYSFDFDNDIDYLIYYNTISSAYTVVEVQESQTSFTATLIEGNIQDESRSFTSIIR